MQKKTANETFTNQLNFAPYNPRRILQRHIRPQAQTTRVISRPMKYAILVLATGSLPWILVLG